MATPAIVIFSGGPDSTASAIWAIQNDYVPELLTFHFKNDRQYSELSASIVVSTKMSLPHTIFDFKSPMQHFPHVVHPLMHAERDVASSQNNRLPFGAGMILATAANYAICNNIFSIIWGTTKDDASNGKFDYTQEFCDILASSISRAINRSFEILAPLSSLHKYEGIKTFFTNKIGLFPLTWSCTTGNRSQCGKCHACVARRLSMKIAGLNDKTKYETKKITYPLSAKQIADPASVDPQVLVHILESEKALDLA